MNPPPLVQVHWPDWYSPQYGVTTAPLELAIENASGSTLSARVHVSADVGTTAPAATLLLRTVSLAPGQRLRVPVPLDRLRSEHSLQRYAGGLRTMVFACPVTALDGSACQAISPPDWFLHVDPTGVVWVYDEATLASRYASGDLVRAGRPPEPVRDNEEVAYPDRVTMWRAPGEKLVTSQEDAVTANEEEER